MDYSQIKTTKLSDLISKTKLIKKRPFVKYNLSQLASEENEMKKKDTFSIMSNKLLHGIFLNSVKRKPKKELGIKFSKSKHFKPIKNNNIQFTQPRSNQPIKIINQEMFNQYIQKRTLSNFNNKYNILLYNTNAKKKLKKTNFNHYAHNASMLLLSPKCLFQSKSLLSFTDQNSSNANMESIRYNSSQNELIEKTKSVFDNLTKLNMNTRKISLKSLNQSMKLKILNRPSRLFGAGIQ